VGLHALGIGAGADELVIVAAPPADAGAVPEWVAGLVQRWQVST
jgi:hypothetical protein